MRNLQHPLLHQNCFWASGFGFYKCCVWKKRNNSHKINRAVDGDSEFEIDADKARDALRKLDQQLELISQKPSNSVPKIKGT